MRRHSEFTAALEGIAADGSRPPADRSAARQILDREKAYARMQTAEMAGVLAGVANDEALAPEVRDAVALRLRQLAEQMQAEGTDLSHWIAAPPDKPQ